MLSPRTGGRPRKPDGGATHGARPAASMVQWRDGVPLARRVVIADSLTSFTDSLVTLPCRQRDANPSPPATAGGGMCAGLAMCVCYVQRSQRASPKNATASSSPHGQPTNRKAAPAAREARSRQSRCAGWFPPRATACSCSPCWACSLCGVVQRAKQLLPGSNPWPEVPIGVCVAGDSEQSVFRHERRMKLVELSGRTTGRLGYTRRPEPTPSEGRQRWHNDALSSPQPPPPALFLRDDCGPPGLLGMGTAAASAGAAGPSQGLRAGWSSGRTEAGAHRGERTTHLRERADDRDSEPDYLLRLTRHGPGGLLTVNASSSFYHWSIHRIWGQ